MQWSIHAMQWSIHAMQWSIHAMQWSIHAINCYSNDYELEVVIVKLWGTTCVKSVLFVYFINTPQHICIYHGMYI